MLAVDPTSKRSGGALLGDRARIDADPADRGLFIRSTAAGERLGGLAPATRAAAQALAAAFDVVVIETVGVGQSETEVAEAADTVAVVVQPGSGDVLQFLKAGIMEVPDVLVVTKADLGQVAQRARRDLHAALRSLGERGVPVVAVPSVPPVGGHRGAGGRARRPPRAGSTSRGAGPARGVSARWPTSSPSTASAACARSAAAARPGPGSSSRTRARRGGAPARARDRTSAPRIAGVAEPSVGVLELVPDPLSPRRGTPVLVEAGSRQPLELAVRDHPALLVEDAVVGREVGLHLLALEIAAPIRLRDDGGFGRVPGVGAAVRALHLGSAVVAAAGGESDGCGKNDARRPGRASLDR